MEKTTLSANIDMPVCCNLADKICCILAGKIYWVKI